MERDLLTCYKVSEPIIVTGIKAITLKQTKIVMHNHITVEQ